MTEDKNLTQNPQEEEEMNIDLMEYARKLWAARKLLCMVAGIAAVIGAIIALGTPKSYTVTVTLAPELRKSSSSLSSIASMLGVSGFGSGSDADALHVSLYPNILSSTPFILDLMDIPVSTMNEEVPDTTLSGYLSEYTKSSLVGTVMSLPFKAVGAVVSLFKSDEEGKKKNEEVNPFQLTKKQADLVKGIRGTIASTVDKKTGVTTISVSMQDPKVAAIVCDTVVNKLQEHIIKYRVSKAQQDCDYWEQLYEERKKDYYEKQKQYANYVDANKNIILQSVRIEQERLQNEMNLAYQVYSNMANQLQMARAKVQEAKPSFAVVEPASVPLRPSGTSRKMVVLAFIFLGVAGASAWILFGKDFWESLKKEFTEEGEKLN